MRRLDDRKGKRARGEERRKQPSRPALTTSTKTHLPAALKVLRVPFHPLSLSLSTPALFIASLLSSWLSFLNVEQSFQPRSVCELLVFPMDRSVDFQRSRRRNERLVYPGINAFPAIFERVCQTFRQCDRKLSKDPFWEFTVRKVAWEPLPSFLLGWPLNDIKQK